MFDTILFDIDGTLLDSENTILSAFKDALKDTLSVTYDRADLKPIIGLHEAVAAELFTTDKILQQKLLKRWTFHIKNNKNSPQLFEDVLNTLLILKQKNIKLGLVTSKTQEHMENDFNKLNINTMFQVIITSDLVKHPKPNAEPLFLAIKTLNSSPSKTLFIGDSYSDFLCAKNANIPFALALWGSNDKKAAHENCLKLTHISDLISLVS